MEALKEKDQSKIAQCIRELYSLESLPSVAERAVRAMHTLIDGNSALVCQIDAQSGAITTLADTIGTDLIPYHEPASALKHEHPGFLHDCDHPHGGATALADVVSLRQWTRTGIYNEVCSKVGMHEQLGAQVHFGQADYVNLVINRSSRNFTARDHRVLNILRHHVAEAFRAASSAPCIPSPLLLEALECAVGGSLIALDPFGRVMFSSRNAQDQLEAFFGEERPFQGGLPSTVRRWIDHELEVFRTTSLEMKLRPTVVIHRGDDSLQLRLASNMDATVHVVWLRLQGPACATAKLQALGFGRRPAQVLYWISQGKSNEEIGIILGIATQTVKGHLKALFSRLGVENRASAAASVSSLLV
jgi:DNA-binding CsgD family transcriptional regulator